MIYIEMIRIRQMPDGTSVVLLQEGDGDEDGRILPIFIGKAEAYSIDMALKDIKPPRPVTHDLLCNILGEAGVEILEVEINEMRDQTYFAEIILTDPKNSDKDAEEHLRISARPSDAIALAVRVGCPIIISEEVMSESSFRIADIYAGEGEEVASFEDLTEEDADEVINKFKSFIDEVRPQDFDDPEEASD